MAADALPVTTGVLRDTRRPLLLWGIAVAAVTAIYVGFWPAMGEGADIEGLIENMPEGLVQALGYDQIATPAGYRRSMVYGLLAPVLLLVFAIGAGARLVAGQEQDGTLELELTAPIARGALLAGRLLALVSAIDMDVTGGNIVAASTALWLLVLGFGTLALAVGAATGRRAVALGSAAGAAVVAFMLHAIGPAVGADWMTAVSPFSWYLEPNPLADGFQPRGLALLAAIPVLAGAVGLVRFRGRDLMV